MPRSILQISCQGPKPELLCSWSATGKAQMSEVRLPLSAGDGRRRLAGGAHRDPLGASAGRVLLAPAAGRGDRPVTVQEI
jgi:hypothetical protein